MLQIGVAQQGILTRSINFKDESRSEILKQVVEEFGYYLSYKPDIFESDPVLSFSFDNQSLDQMLSTILGTSYEWHLIDQYLAITKKKPDKPARREHARVVYDTITVEERRIVYDTQEVVTRQTVYDTVSVRQTKYDTIQVIAERAESFQKLRIGAFFSPVIHREALDDEIRIHHGVELGTNALYTVRKLNLQLSAAYGYAQRRVKLTDVEIQVEEQVDTVAQFYVIEDGVEIPFYVTDTTLVERELLRIYDLMNTMHYLQVSIEAGRQFQLRKVSIGTYLGLNFRWVIDWDTNEVDNDASSSDVNDTFSARLNFQVPVLFGRSSNNSMPYITPFIATEHIRNDLSKSWRLGSFGIRFGYFFN